MGFLTTLFGTPKIVNTVADTVKSGVGMLDNAFYTDQEKSEMNLKTGELWLRIQETTAGENSIRSITRRILAWMIMGSFIFLIICGCVIWKFDPEWAEYIKQIVVSSDLGYLALIIGFFYFGSYGLGGMLSRKGSIK